MPHRSRNRTSDTSMQVPFFENRRAFARVASELEQALPALLAQPTLVNCAQVRKFEADIAAYTGAHHVVAVGNATDALVIALTALGIGPGDEVIVPCYSFFASVSSILRVGATPVFVDIESDTYALDVVQIEGRITPRTRAILPVHLFRQMADMDAVLDLASRFRLQVLEDSAEGIGMRHAGVHAGLLGDVGVLSFFPTKTLGALGDAGLLLTQDAALAERARRIADNGRDRSGMALCAGFNSRLDDLQALYLRLQLEHLDADIRQRASHAARYDAGLAGLHGVRVPGLRARGSAQAVVNYVYLIQANHRDELARHLAQNGVSTETYYPLPLHLQPACAHLSWRRGEFPVAEAAAERALGLPMHAELEEAQIDRVCTLIAQFQASTERRVA